MSRNFWISITGVVVVGLAIGAFIYSTKPSKLLLQPDSERAVVTSPPSPPIAAQPTPSKRAETVVVAQEIQPEQQRQLLFSPPDRPRISNPTNRYNGPDVLRGYAEERMLNWVNRANQAFGFSTSPISMTNMLYGARCDEPGGLIGSVTMNNGRHVVSVVHNDIELYFDSWFREGVFRDPARLEALSQQKNYITEEDAKLIAHNSLKSLGLRAGQLAALEPPVVSQQTWLERQNQLLPVFVVVYPARRTPEEHREYLFRFDIMGIIPGGFVSEFWNRTYGNEKFLRTESPPGYREKVTDYLQSLKQKKEP